MKTGSPILEDSLKPYQKAWLEDRSRFKIGLWSRQTGKSYTTAFEAVLDCLERPGQLWVCLSAGERQAFEWLRKAKEWCGRLAAAVKLYTETPDEKDARCSKGEIHLANGSRVIAIPANPDTARGYSANLVLDEFAIHERPFDIWAAIYPSITSPYGGEKKLRIVSTPKGRGNKFADLWEHNEGYAKHKVTILDAVAQGLAVDVAELRAGVDDDDIWQQEYMCEFIDSTSVLLPYELIGSCESDTVRDDNASPLYIGMDIGRKKDLSVIVTAAKLGDVLAVLSVDTLAKMPFDEQLDLLVSKAASRRVKGVCIDATGLGAMLAENARRRLGAKVREVVFNAATKNEMFTLMRRKFEERSVRVPVSRDLREDLHAVQRVVSTGGNVSYSAPRNEDGHSDRAAALALCCLAAHAVGEYVPPFGAGTACNPDWRTIYG